MPRVVFTDHAKARWLERIAPVFSPSHAEQMVRESRPASKRERRGQGVWKRKSFGRKATKRERESCRVNEQFGVMFFVVCEGDMVVKTVVKIEVMRSR